MIPPLSEGAALLLVVLLGFLPTEIWRSLAVVAGRKVTEGSPVFHWVRAAATALLAAIIARMLFSPAGALAAVPLALRIGAVVGGVAGYALVRRSVFAGVLAGEVILVGGALLLGG